MSILDHTVPIVEVDEPDMSYEYNEFVVRRDLATGTWYAGSDGGCSCYDGFDESNFVEYHDHRQIRVAFAEWVAHWYDGLGKEAAAWDEFNQAVNAALDPLWLPPEVKP